MGVGRKKRGEVVGVEADHRLLWRKTRGVGLQGEVGKTLGQSVERQKGRMVSPLHTN